MIYPKFLSPGSRVGICAPSAGFEPQEWGELDQAEAQLRAKGWQVEETPSVRAGGVESAAGQVRAAELNALAEQEDVELILCAAGGDFLLDMRPFVDWERLHRSPRWIQGYSDPTGLLYPVTTLLDVATIYGPNAGGYAMTALHESLENSLSILTGKIPVQQGFSHYETVENRGTADGYTLTEPVRWGTLAGDFTVSGRLIGGCMECLSELIGTPYDGTRQFLERYGEEGILWYFDVFALRSEQVYNTLCHMKQAGWFEHARGFLFGRVMFPGTEVGMSYEAALRKALSGFLVAFDADIGHVHPAMTLINGSYATLTCAGGNGRLEMELR